MNVCWSSAVSTAVERADTGEHNLVLGKTHLPPVPQFPLVVLHSSLKATEMCGEPWVGSSGGREGFDRVWTRAGENTGSFD